VPIFLGIDAGGTKTECALGDEHRVLGTSIAGTAKIRKVGEDAAGQALETGVQDVCRKTDINPQQITQTCIGISGSSIPEVVDWTYGVLKQLVAGEIKVVNDTLIAHHAAFQGGPGVLVIAGTGSNVLGINERGETARAGGWGPIISDEGSGFWIGRTAVAQAMRAHDSGNSTALLNAVMKAWKLVTREEVVSMANANPPPDFASLLPEVLRSADSGDALAREILVSAANELGQLTRIVIRRLWPGPAEISVATTGGVFVHSPDIRQMFANAVRAERPEAQVNDTPVHPVLGALSIARQNYVVERRPSSA
jgi:N-acetylglucosamine kinase-like BadF-type ATPase